MATTVSESASNKAGGVLKDTRGLSQIVLDFIGYFAILPLSETVKLSERDRNRQARHHLSPSPGGEGWDEGEQSPN